MSIDDKITEAMKILSTLATDARNIGEDSLVYAANRAWHELFRARNKRTPAQLLHESTNGKEDGAANERY